MAERADQKPKEVNYTKLDKPVIAAFDEIIDRYPQKEWP
jgi:hypothetical protein